MRERNGNSRDVDGERERILGEERENVTEKGMDL